MSEDGEKRVELRAFEEANDRVVLPELFVVARLDGRGFTRLTKSSDRFAKPFDVDFRDAMLQTAEALFDVGFRVAFAYAQSDEVSLLMHRDDEVFSRRAAKWISILAAEASARLSRILETTAVMDCRLCEIPTPESVVAYFRWRSDDAHRNALSSHCYWALRREGRDAREATRELSGLSISEQNELLFSRGINYNDLPAWQKRGVGLRWEEYEKEGFNPKTGESVTTTRRRVTRDLELPMGDAWTKYLEERIAEATS